MEKDHTTGLPPLTAPMAAIATARWQRIERANTDLLLPASPLALSVLACSEFVARVFSREPQLLLDCLAGERPATDTYRQKVNSALESAADENDAVSRLRQLRNREMALIAWADLSGLVEIDEVLAATTQLAEAFIDCSTRYLYTQLCAQWGTPRNAAGNPQSLVVIGMGKLGGGELNFSSDIDLIFAFPEAGETDGKKTRDNSEFFTRLGQRLIRMLNETTADGFVYRVDMRLRPFGDSGPLAASFAALESYYEAHGREWERYAMIKARAITDGEDAAGETLLATLRPFVYRRYLDYGAIESLRELKAKIAVEVERKGMQHNIKLGPGGIREIEFIGQAFQLIRGGQNAALQTRGIIEALVQLAEAGHLQRSEVDQLLSAYRFLRRLENRLQMRNDEQTHTLPIDENDRALIAMSMGFDNLNLFEQTLGGHRAIVEQLFQSVFKVESDDSGGESASATMQSLWNRLIDGEPGSEMLAEAGFVEPGLALERLMSFKRSRFYANLSSRARDRLDALMPMALDEVLSCDNPDETLSRWVNLLRAIAGRSVYLAVMLETPAVLTRLIGLLSASAWVAEFVARHPLVIDELLDPSPIDKSVDRAQIEAGARQALARLPDADLGEQMDVLRHYKQTHTLRVVNADLAGTINVMQVSDQLSWLAEALLQVVSDLIWDEQVARHGRPHCVVDGERVRPGFGIVAYGKLGGGELGYGSDLDIVFLHESEGEQQRTDSDNPVDNAVFFARLAQKLVHFISTLTAAGTLYEVDTRLRPNGASGLLVSSIDAFDDYQRHQAWTWEHQALVRGEMVVGSKRLRRRFVATRERILRIERDRVSLAKDVVDMRERMFRELSKGNARVFDIKQDRGGVADIEFMVQYLVLAWAHKYPVLTQYTGNFRLLDIAGVEQIITAEQADKLAQSYLELRNRIHRCVLQDKPALIERDDINADVIDGIVEIWQVVMPATKTDAGDK